MFIFQTVGTRNKAAAVNEGQNQADGYRKEFYNTLVSPGSPYHDKFYAYSGGEKRRNELVDFYAVLRTKYRQTESNAQDWIKRFMHQEFEGGPTLFKKYELSVKEMEALLQTRWSINSIATSKTPLKPKQTEEKALREHCKGFNSTMESRGEGDVGWICTSLHSWVGETKWTRNPKLINDPDKRADAENFQALRKIAKDVMEKYLDPMGSTKNTDAFLDKIRHTDHF